MIAIAPTTAQIPAIRNEHGILAHGNTYATDWFRVTGRNADMPETTEEPAAEVLEALADAVDARRALDRHRRVRKDNNPTWRKLSLAAMRTTKAYADLAGMTPNDAADKVRGIAECFSS